MPHSQQCATRLASLLLPTDTRSIECSWAARVMAAWFVLNSNWKACICIVRHVRQRDTLQQQQVRELQYAQYSTDMNDCTLRSECCVPNPASYLRATYTRQLDRDRLGLTSEEAAAWLVTSSGRRQHTCCNALQRVLLHAGFGAKAPAHMLQSERCTSRLESNIHAVHP